MKSHAQVVVIGGGVVGVSVLYHLTKAGWKESPKAVVKEDTAEVVIKEENVKAVIAKIKRKN